MKKIIFALFAVMLVAFASCGNGAKEKALSEKIQKHETLTQEDYSFMIDYIDNALTSVLSSVEKKGLTNVNEAVLEQELDKEFPYAQEYSKALSDDFTKLDNDNSKKYQTALQNFMVKAFELSTKSAMKSGFNNAATDSE